MSGTKEHQVPFPSTPPDAEMAGILLSRFHLHVGVCFEGLPWQLQKAAVAKDEMTGTLYRALHTGLEVVNYL